MESLIGRGIAMVILVILIVGVVVTGFKLKQDSTASTQAGIFSQISQITEKMTLNGSNPPIGRGGLYDLTPQINNGVFGSFGNESNMTCPINQSICFIVLPSSGVTSFFAVSGTSASQSLVISSSYIIQVLVSLPDCLAYMQTNLGPLIYTDKSGSPVAGCDASLSTPGMIDIAIQ